jgi:hypothetical protein
MRIFVKRTAPGAVLLMPIAWLAWSIRFNLSMAGMERYDEEDGGLDGSRGWRLGSKLGGLVIGEAPELSRSWDALSGSAEN